ncbi:ribosomal L7Ae/L30e/S12e/Gadd45 family protein [Sporosarcina cyprini]|uniref:ribosomal L7Ae/L30e/S12e/Gadd45 family protein n=1 Tax=Sporosarcina cyprini TaxID=2910523 RepID=UPI001EDF0371|nr:ribosomal L7Ae/L30e/S12e/Gadd45 family protein [Sporosarcina cyprini]MCG3087844.1 ribosomal L7Ae/L30e/S12e/Gadd45 family protein [Sporosarcina cyprini]
MSYDKVEQAQKTIIGTKQTVKAIRTGAAKEIILATDADERFIAPVIREAELHGIPITYVDSRITLGHACGIEVGAVAVAITV